VTPLGEFGAPPDAVAWGALGVAALIAVLARDGRIVTLAALHRRAAIGALAGAAFLLSCGYVVHYLRGGPRIIDATSYFLQARALAEGHVTFSIPAPSGSFRGRFLLPSLDGSTLAVIFPPGYPAVLAVGFALGAPMLVGPVLGAALVVVTAALARRVFDDTKTALLAAALSTVCAVLRYHTADTMSHGWAALLLATSVWASCVNTRRALFMGGVCAGILFATRPASGVVALGLAAYAAARPVTGGVPEPARTSWLPIASRLGLVFLGSAAPVFAFVWQQRTATGSWFGSTQLAYYALADGPPGCFRYGFGGGVGCLFEHGDFVRARLGDGFGAVAASLTTLRRLKMHLADAGNVELFAPLVVCAVAHGLCTKATRLAALGAVGIVLAYVPFYFDGNYPGGGARFFADALPLEHVLLAGLLVRWNAARFALPLSLLGFALHTSYDHRQLASRDGGKPMFESAVLERAQVTTGLLFVDTDHGFNLAHDPDARDAARTLVVARRRDDAHDVLLWNALGRPRAYTYGFSSDDAVSSTLAVWTRERTDPVAQDAVLRFEAEAEWPPLSVAGGSTYPVFPSCASAGRGLLLRPVVGEALRVRLPVLIPRAGQYRLASGWSGTEGQRARVELALDGQDWALDEALPAGSCAAFGGPAITLGPGQKSLYISTSSELALDYLELRPSP
jgi:hypothetical protein